VPPIEANDLDNILCLRGPAMVNSLVVANRNPIHVLIKIELPKESVQLASGWNVKPMPKPPSGSPIDVHIGHKLRAQRIALGLSQSELGAALGITFQQIQKYEKGKNRIAAGQLFRFAQFLRVRISYFYEGILSSDDISAADERVSDLVRFVATSEGANLCSAFMRISNPASRKSVIDLISSLAESVPRRAASSLQTTTSR
jgi:transcriptional regulator with XRE-family HTH domain